MNRIAVRAPGGVLVVAAAEAAMAAGAWAGRLASGFVRHVIEAREREAERHMARLLAQSGGRLTDDLERRAMCAFSSPFGGRTRR
jgi:hypothetical protein